MKSFAISGEELRDLLLSVGSHRRQRRLTPIEVANLFRREIRAGSTLSDCAHLVHLDGTTMVNRFLKLRRLDPKIQPNIAWGQSGVTVGFTIASEIAKLAQSDHVRLVTAVLELSLKKSEVIQVVQLRRRTNCDIDSAINQIVKTRPTVVRKYLFFGGITANTTKTVLVDLHQDERDNIFTSVLNQLSLSDNEGHRLGGGNFSFIGEEGFADKVNQMKPDFESLINEKIDLLLA